MPLYNSEENNIYAALEQTYRDMRIDEEKKSFAQSYKDKNMGKKYGDRASVVHDHDLKTRTNINDDIPLEVDMSGTGGEIRTKTYRNPEAASPVPSSPKGSYKFERYPLDPRLQDNLKQVGTVNPGPGTQNVLRNYSKTLPPRPKRTPPPEPRSRGLSIPGTGYELYFKNPFKRN